jgi:hypothetical protein
MELNDAAHQDSVPTMGGNSSASLRDRFRPAPLCRPVIAFMHRSLERNQLRRSVCRGSHLHVCIDGEELLQFDAKVGVGEPFRVPISTSYIEIFGDDDDGALLLAVFPLPEPEVIENDRGPHMSVILDGGQTIKIEIARGESTAGEVNDYVLKISYGQSPEAARRNVENTNVRGMSIATGRRPLFGPVGE